MRNPLQATLFIAVFAATALPAGATSTISSTPTPAADAIQIPTSNYFGSGPQSYVGSDPASVYTWTSTNASFQSGAAFGYTGGYGFGGNGYWDGGLGPMNGVNDAFNVYGVTDTMTLDFTSSTPVYEIGDYFNFVPGGTTPTTLSVYDGATLLDSVNLNNYTFPSGTDVGLWVTFTESSPITSFTQADNYVGFADPYTTGYTTPVIPITGPSSATPEPSSLLLLGSGLAGLAGLLRRKFAKSL